MQVEVEEISKLERRLTIGVPASRVDSEVNQRLQKMAPQVSMKGFRPGKVPAAVVQKQHGASVRQEIIADLIQQSFQEAIENENLRPTGMPSVEQGISEDPNSLKFECKFEIYPEVGLPDIATLEIEVPTCEILESDIDDMIERLREQRPSWSAVERAAQKDDQVNCDFVGTVDGEPFAGNEGKGIDFVVGSGYMLPEFEAGVEGVSAGEECEIELTFPEDYPSDEIKGSTAKFKIQVNTVSEKALPELDADFFKGWGIEGDDLESFRSEVKKTMEHEVERIVKTQVKDKAIESLVSATEVELPNSLLEAEVHRLQHQHADSQEHTEACEHGEASDETRDQAQRRVMTGLILMEIVNKQELTADGDRVREMIENMAQSYGEPERVLEYYYSDEKRLAEVQSAVLEEQVVEWVVEQATANEKPVSYKELMETQAA